MFMLFFYRKTFYKILFLAKQKITNFYGLFTFLRFRICSETGWNVKKAEEECAQVIIPFLFLFMGSNNYGLYEIPCCTKLPLKL